MAQTKTITPSGSFEDTLLKEFREDVEAMQRLLKKGVSLTFSDGRVLAPSGPDGDRVLAGRGNRPSFTIEAEAKINDLAYVLADPEFNGKL
jgi:hypothetical protein